MKRKLIGILSLLMIFLMHTSYAQQQTITGVVTDNIGIPLPGVNVIIKNKNKGAQTDFNGEYSIDAKKDDKISFSYVGFLEQLVTVNFSSEINIALQTKTAELDQVVIVAYGSQRKKSIVGTVTTLNAKTLEKQQLTSVTNAIQGTVAGVNVITTGGQPGINPTIRIRGIGSINASADPLIVLDGVPFNGNINSISGDQIESMNVLKDASSTALYGSRAANGVVLITTKKGSFISESKLSISASSGISKPAVPLHKLLKTDDLFKYSWEAQKNSNQYIRNQNATIAGQNASNQIVGSLGYNPYNIAQPLDENGNIKPDANLLWETDWENEILRDIALRNEYTVGLTGGSEKSRYFLSANYLHQEGSVRESNFERITTRLNLESNITDWLTVGLNTSLSSSNQNYPNQEGNDFRSSIQWIYNVSSIYPLYRRDVNGSLINNDLGNPIFDYGATADQSINGRRNIYNNENVAGTLYNDIRKNTRTNITSNGFARIAFTDDLSFKTNIAYENFLRDFFGYEDSNVGSASNVNGRVTNNRNITTTFNINNTLNYTKRFGEHHINADLIFESYAFKYDASGAIGVGLPQGVKDLNSTAKPTFVRGFAIEERITSYLGRLSYGLKDRYFLEGSFRRDGSSRFSPDTRWGNFFAIGASWILSDEGFLADSRNINLLKIRASYGELGNNRIGNDFNNPSYFPYLQIFESGYNELNNIGVLFSGVTDPNLTWETSALLDIGTDFAFFKNRLEGTISYYSKESVDLIFNRPLPISTGNSNITTNSGSIKNSGIEVSLSGKIIDAKKVQWSIGANFAFTKNEITKLTQGEVIVGTKKYKVGKSIYEFFIQEWAGVDPANGQGLWYTDVLDTNGNPTGQRKTTNNYSEATRYYQESSLPDVTGGITTDLVIGNFDLNVLFNFSFGALIYDSSYQGLMNGFGDLGRSASPDVSARWQKPGDITDIPLLLNSPNNFSSTSSRFLFDNDYIRMKAITLGFTLPDLNSKKLKTDAIRFYLRGDNLFTWQSHFGIDPEQNLGGTTNSRSSILKTFSVGLNVQF